MVRYKIKKGDIKRLCHRWYPVGNSYILCSEVAYSIIGKDYMSFPSRFISWDKEEVVLGTCSCPTQTWRLDHYFKDWQNPTIKEIEMFEMVTGEYYIHRYLNIEIT